MKINNGMGDLLSQRWNAKAKEQEKVLEQIATGKRINRASDDAAGIAMAQDFEKQIRAYRGASENISDGMSALAIADGGASTISDMLQRQRELAVQSANGAFNDDQRGALDKEFQGLSQEIDRISKSTDFNGQHLLDGSGKLSDGTGTVRAGDGANDGVAVPANDLSLSSLSLGSEKLSSSDDALRALNAIDSAMRKVNDNRASTGSASNRLDYALSNVENQKINTITGLSNIQDLDYAQAMTNKVKNDIQQNAGASSINQFNQLTRTHLLALLQ